MTLPFHPFPIPCLPAFSGVPDAMRVETTTLLPGGGLVTLTVRPAGTNYLVSDDAAGRTALLGLGIQDLTGHDTRRGNEIAEARGLAFEGQGFALADVSADQLPAGIAFVADACRAWVAAAIEARSRYREQHLTQRAVGRLRASLPGLQIDTERELLGASTKRYRFDIVVTLSRDRFAVFETVLPAPTSMAAAHLKFYDLLQAQRDWPREAVVEDLGVWPSDDLAVIQQVATHVRGFDHPWDDLGRLAT